MNCSDAAAEVDKEHIGHVAFPDTFPLSEGGCMSRSDAALEITAIKSSCSSKVDPGSIRIYFPPCESRSNPHDLDVT